jgi:hypothetical protein
MFKSFSGRPPVWCCRQKQCELHAHGLAWHARTLAAGSLQPLCCVVFICHRPMHCLLPCNNIMQKLLQACSRWWIVVMVSWCAAVSGAGLARSHSLPLFPGGQQNLEVVETAAATHVGSGTCRKISPCGIRHVQEDITSAGLPGPLLSRPLSFYITMCSCITWSSRHG